MIENIVQWSPGVSLEQMEKQIILAAFRFYRGNKTTTAQSLGIAIRTLDSRLEKYEKDDADRVVKEKERESDREEFLKAQRGLPSSWKPKTSSSVRVPVESLEDLPKEQAMSVPVREEVQKLSLATAPTGRKGKRRGSIQGSTEKSDSV